jgi:hypothetical protein
VAPGKEVNLPGSVSNCLLAVRESVQAVRNRMSTINEMRVSIGRKRRQPSKLGGCARSRGNSCERDDLDGMHEILLAMTLDVVSMQSKR